jgi:hypothetical protein
LLEAGADYRLYQHNDYRRLIHVVAGQERRLKEYTSEHQAGFHELVRWLEDHGESYEAAKADIARWDSWSRSTGEFRRKMDAEIAERKAREQAEAEPQPK